MRSAVAGKARVHELAKELGVESKTVLAKLQELGEYVKSASSTVEAPVARRLRASFQVGASAPPAPSAGPPPAASKPAPAPADGKAGAPSRRTTARPTPPPAKRPSGAGERRGPVPGPPRPAAPAAPVVK